MPCSSNLGNSVSKHRCEIIKVSTKKIEIRPCMIRNAVITCDNETPVNNTGNTINNTI